MSYCSTCKFFKPSLTHEDFGECRLHAPQPTIGGSVVLEDRMAQWPVVDTAHWCGQRVAKQEKVKLEMQQAPDVPKRASRTVKKKAS